MKRAGLPTRPAQGFGSVGKSGGWGLGVHILNVRRRHKEVKIIQAMLLTAPCITHSRPQQCRHLSRHLSRHLAPHAHLAAARPALPAWPSARAAAPAQSSGPAWQGPCPGLGGHTHSRLAARQPSALGTAAVGGPASVAAAARTTCCTECRRQRAVSDKAMPDMLLRVIITQPQQNTTFVRCWRVGVEGARCQMLWAPPLLSGPPPICLPGLPLLLQLCLLSLQVLLEILHNYMQLSRTAQCYSLPYTPWRWYSE